ncbi:phenylalanyl-tRNA synthetase, alpha subunit [Thermoanaerobacter thermohydrosulfuricus]|jgi:phenylalanyl-tRNA synthetase alpha chain|uniref:Phenylalanine--tRNA ligase alpha subunit n=6 Tax=Thermoanaerobacter TaxID=1754 RepID=B0K8B7_THEP3|nr:MULTISPECIES: phenylalanine--tRNA ligase subunit alpha [Thermoanaerobacter]EIW00489.1 LOW QUALITY PROTEIN: phenylalanyl-tRNA synthetase, alpha subunit [Thermoanaerobacter siderophilus SR4]ABY94430.1 phenylalanyl-tRNA synthetase, alpha subunit [Thermoanaerobacter pseudethanolicus ATCC 33223]ADV79382.1 phenylalanyl-tRNA synthetase, alpha subunit [Thermoanaerobacter brockii subsp. finnii Ako-1]AEM79050.1 Phenylalanyl-tRNA synthetase alpha chain [Thermoanaerobacter wiegelii Rt8.B1]EMT38589.1 ph
MEELLRKLYEDAQKEILSADSLQQIENLRVKYLGKKGELTQILRGMGSLKPEERPVIGQIANEVREKIEGLLTETKNKIAQLEKEKRIKSEYIDITMPGKPYEYGHKHPMTQVLDEIKKIFLGLGFSIAEGPEIEFTYYNFEALNTPEDHPARDLQDTFYVTSDILLRTQTSPVQVRTMEKNKPPIRVISPGRVYRSDEIDATHSPVFHQMEGLVVDEGITMGDLKGVLNIFAKKFFGEDTQTKFRPHYFPFTEPSAEMDVSCFACGGKGCRVCGYTGWIEILGAGMVHPNVLRMSGIDPEKYSGFAFGLGIDRITMLKYGIEDLRLLFENDLRFIQQF